METEKEDGTKNYQGDAWEDEDIMVDEDVSEQDHPADYFFQDPKEHSATNNSQYDSTIGSQYADQQDDCNAFVIRGSAASTSFRYAHTMYSKYNNCLSLLLKLIFIQKIK
jgi:hypothetical protein